MTDEIMTITYGKVTYQGTVVTKYVDGRVCIDTGVDRLTGFPVAKVKKQG